MRQGHTRENTLGEIYNCVAFHLSQITIARISLFKGGAHYNDQRSSSIYDIIFNCEFAEIHLALQTPQIRHFRERSPRETDVIRYVINRTMERALFRFRSFSWISLSLSLSPSVFLGAGTSCARLRNRLIS